MHELDDNALLHEFMEHDSEEAFATLVKRHVSKIYSVALRHTNNSHQAEEITQAVFVILARKCRSLGKKVILSGWLYQTARLTAVTFIRSEIRRARRQQEAHMQTLPNETESDVWPQIASRLDEAMGALNATDRHAVVLRFFDGRSLSEVGTVLGASEDAAKKRVNRAVEKLRVYYKKRGVVLPAAILTAAISSHSVQAAPAILAKTATAVALTKGATASTSTLTLIQEALKTMAWSKIKTAIAAGAIVLLATGTATTLTVQHHLNSRRDFPRSSWSFVGYADPRSALQSAMWAWGNGDTKTFVTSLSPEAQKREGNHLEQIQSADMIREFRNVSGFRILDQQVVTNDQIMLHFYVDGVQQAKNASLIKIGSEWKLDAVP